MSETSPNIPPGAKPYEGPKIPEISPGDKLMRCKGLNFQERSAFLGICEFGPEQLIDCYGTLLRPDRYVSPFEFKSLCSKCPYCLDIQNSGYNGDSISFPYFIQSHYAELICDENPKAFVYFVSDGSFVKIGIADDLKKRMKGLQTGNPKPLSLLAVVPTVSKDAARILEQKLHYAYSRYRACGEWFSILGLIDQDSFSSYWSPSDYLGDEE